MVKNSIKTSARKLPSRSSRPKNPKSAFNLKHTKPSRRQSSLPIFQSDFRNLILSIIIINVVIVTIAVVTYFQLIPKHRIPATIDNLAANYYENIFYEDLVTSDKFTGDLDDALERYTRRGLSPISLHQLLIQTKADRSTRLYLEEYCDTETSSITFYPDAPFSRTSYHYNIKSSCEFE